MDLTPKTLKKYYDLFKQWSTGEQHKKEVTILDHKVTLLYTISIDNSLSFDCEINDIELDKTSKKFFDRCCDVFGCGLYDSSCVQDLCYTISNGLDKKLQPLRATLSAYGPRKKFYDIMFDRNGQLRSFDEVKLLYKNRDVVQPRVQVSISSNYTAVIEKGKNIQVGCQSIPIETVKKIVEEYEKINK